MLQKAQAVEMLKMQNFMNEVINKEWVSMGWPFLRAVLVEATEAIEHVGWKWWKKQTPDWPQVRLELVDIWHFILSNEMLRTDSIETAAKNIVIEVEYNRTSIVFDENSYEIANMNVIEKFELMIGLAAARRVEIALFKSLMDDAEMSWDDLISLYVGKNVLNRFRQANGYKEGTYIKEWNGEEDNVHLTRILQRLPEVDLESFVMAELTTAYASVRK